MAGEVSEWLKEAVLKTVEPRGSVGSNPTFSELREVDSKRVSAVRKHRKSNRMLDASERRGLKGTGRKPVTESRIPPSPSIILSIGEVRERLNRAPC